MGDVLSSDVIQDRLTKLGGWSGDADKIAKTFEHDDFVAAMGFVQQVALVAERLFHHPDLRVSWGTVEVEIRSHAAGGVTEQCLELASRIEERAPAGR